MRQTESAATGAILHLLQCAQLGCGFCQRRQSSGGVHLALLVLQGCKSILACLFGGSFVHVVGLKLLGLLDGFVDGANHVERLFWHAVVFTARIPLKPRMVSSAKRTCLGHR
jgi:hypothetical protein